MESEAQSKRILILDDDPEIRGGICSYLQTLGLEAISTAQWTDALDLVVHRPPDLILLDLHMPTVQGEVVLDFIRKQGSAVPVIVMSAHLTEEIVGELRLLGVREFLQKPFHLTDLGDLVRKGLGSQGTPLRSDEPPPAEAKAGQPADLPPPPSIKTHEGEVSGERDSRSRGRRKRRRSRKIPDPGVYFTIAWLCLLGALILLLISYIWSRFTHFPFF